MPEKSTAAQHKTSQPDQAPLKSVPGGAGQGTGQPADRLIYERVRLGILSALAVNEELAFNDLKALFDTSDGNLSAHARKLENAGYITCHKSFEDRRPKTVYRLTAAGRKALNRYLDHMEAVIRATRGR